MKIREEAVYIERWGPEYHGTGGKTKEGDFQMFLETDNLILKKAEFEDWKSMYRNVWSRSETAKHMAWRVTTDVPFLAAVKTDIRDLYEMRLIVERWVSICGYYCN